MEDKLQGMIRSHEMQGDFTHVSVTMQEIKAAERKLAISIPKQYVDFLFNYGHGGIGGVEVIGMGKTGMMLFVEETEKYRQYGLPKNFLVVEDCDEWVYCIDCNTGKVVSWSDGIIKNCYQSFEDYLEDRFSDAIENL